MDVKHLKSVTHNTFSFGLGLYAALHLGFSLISSILLAAWLSLLINWVIDAFGHRTQNGRSTRAFITHSVFLAPLWGGLLGLMSVALADAIFQTPFSTVFSTLVVLLGSGVALSHLLLDSLTEGGVYWRLRRIAIAHARFDDPVLNGVFVLLGVALIMASLLSR
jgi:hypothetical protein